MSTELILGLVSLTTSTVAAILGLGGGMLLIAIMPAFVPIHWVIPVHGVTQLASNGSRAVFAYKHMVWHVVPQFILGSVCGVALFSLIAIYLPADVASLTIGGYILLSLWSQSFDHFVRRYETMFSAGFFQSGLGIVVGATGPLTTALLSKQLNNKEQIIATGAVLMLLSHGFKVMLFGIIGFAYQEHLFLITSMVTGAIVGSWLGTRLRQGVTQKAYQRMLKWVLTLLSLKLLVTGSIVLFF